MKPRYVILLTFLLLTGCWDSLEIDKRAVVVGISVDEAGEGAAKEESEVSHLRGKFPAPKKKMIRVTAQIALPGQIPLGPGEGGGGGDGGGGGKRTVWPIQVVGHTIDDAMMNLQQQLSSPLFFGHLRIIVVSQAVAKKGLQNVNDYFRRNPDVRRTTWMIVSKEKAGELMMATPKLGRLPALYLLTTMDQAVRMGKFPKDFVGLFWSAMSKKGQEGYLPFVELKKTNNVELNGMAYFKDDVMAGVTKPFEIAGYMGVKGISVAGYRGFVKIDDKGNTVTIYATSRKSNIDIRIQEGLPHFTLNVFTEINVEEKLNEQFLINKPEVIKKIEQENIKSFTKMIRDLIRQTQEKESDIFGFGEYVRAKKPQYWNRQVKTKDRWQNMYKNVVFEIKINTKLRRIGMKTR